MPIVGDTVRLTAVFYDFSGVLIDPTTVIVQIYDSEKVELGEPIILGPEAKDSAGTYHYNYTIPEGHKKLYYEFKGMLQGQPSVGRAEMKITWLPVAET